MKLTSTLALLATAILTAGVALSAAAQPRGGPDQIIDRLDQDGDLKLSVDEFDMPRRGRDRGPLAGAHSDGDGTLSRAELQTYLDQRTELAFEQFDQADLDGNGILSEDERKLAAFNRIDANSDGYIDAAELAAARKGRGPSRTG